MNKPLLQLASHSQINMEETIQRLAVGIYGFIATEMLTDVDLVFSIIARVAFIVLTLLSIIKMWRELK